MNGKTVVLRVNDEDLEVIKQEIRERALDIDLSPIINDFYAGLFLKLRE